MQFSVLAGTIVQLLALVAVGVGLRHFKVLRGEDSKVLNAVIVYAALPALIFTVVYKAPLNWDVAKIAAIAWIVALAGFAVAWPVARLLKLPRATAGAFVICAALGNTGYIGYPVVRMLLGDVALSRAVFYDVFGTVGVLFTVGIIVASRTGEHAEGRISVVRELFTFPAMIALLVALVARLVPVSPAVSGPVVVWLGLLGNMSVPLIMVSLGLSLTVEGFRSSRRALGIAAGVKLLLLPAVAFGAALLLRETVWLRLVVLQASMPTAMLSLVVGQRFNLDTDFIASEVLLTTAACVATIPLVQLLVR